MSALDNDETYDAKIFSLGLLLSSLFVLNSMGVIDESAIDRLFLVSELSKHVCIQADQKDETTQEQLAQFFPPFIWLLRDFMLDMRSAEGHELSAADYLESALEIRPNGNSKRIEERNYIRESLQTLFPKRECLTLVRPATDEAKLRNANDLDESELRPEFRTQMELTRTRILQLTRRKSLFGQVFDGPKLAHLAQAYLKTMNSGAVPDIKGAWEYVSEATNRAAEQKAGNIYEQGMDQTQDTLLSQSEFDSIHKKLQEEALHVFKTESVDGLCRSGCFQRLKQSMQAQKVKYMNLLQEKSKLYCKELCQKLIKDIDFINWDEFHEELTIFQSQYDTLAKGPAKKSVLLEFFKTDCIELFQAFTQQLEQKSQLLLEKHTAEANAVQQQLEQSIQMLNVEKTALKEKNVDISSQLGEEKDRNVLAQENLKECKMKIESLEALNQEKQTKIEELKEEIARVENEFAQMNIHLDHANEKVRELTLDSCALREKNEQMTETLKQQQDELRSQSDRLQQTEEQVEKLTTSLDEAQEKARGDSQEIEGLEKTKMELVQQNSQQMESIQSLQENIMTLVTNHEDILSAQQKERIRLLKKIREIDQSLSTVYVERQVEKCLQDCVTSISDSFSTRSFSEERNVLQQQLGDLYLKISTLPEFYQRQVFCSEDPQPDFFDVLTSFVSS